jgi:hypothetical protein
MRALNGNPTPSTEAEIDAYLRQAENTALGDFFEKFFACCEIPENKTRFNYASIVQRARAATSAGDQEPSPG